MPGRSPNVTTTTYQPTIYPRQQLAQIRLEQKNSQHHTTYLIPAANILSVIMSIAVFVLVSYWSFGRELTQVLTDSDSPISPAPFSIGIFGIILGGMITWSIATTAQINELPEERNVVHRVGCTFVMINVFFTAWMLAVVTDTDLSDWLAVVFALFMIGALLILYERAEFWVPARLVSETNPFNLVINEGLFSISLGWAAYLAVNTFLYTLSAYNLFSTDAKYEAACCISLVALAVIVTVFSRWKKDAVVAVAYLWAAVAVGIHHLRTSTRIVAMLCILVVSSVSMWTWLQSRERMLGSRSVLLRERR